MDIKRTIHQETQHLSKQALYEYAYETVVVLKHHIHHDKIYGIQDEKYTALVRKLMYTMQRLCTKYKAESKTEKELFVTTNTNSLYKIYDAFYNPETKRLLLTQKEQNNIRSITDPFYSCLCGIARAPFYFHQLPTRLFQDFIRGVTHFAGEEVYSRPSYHRSGSCGPADSDHLKRLMGKENRGALLRCYVERMIYDRIFERVLHKQDTGHRLELESLYRMVTQFADVHVILHFDGVIPDRLSIKVTTLDGIPQYREEYRKYADGRVLAIRADNIAFQQNENMRYKYRVQTYEQQGAWSSTVPKVDHALFEHLVQTSPSMQSRAWSHPHKWHPQTPEKNRKSTRRIANTLP